MPDQLTGYWDATNQQFQGPSNVPSGSVEAPTGIQATATSTTVPLGIATRAGIIKDARAAAITPPTGNATYTVDIRRNNLSILTAPITLNSTSTARGSVVGTLIANPPAVAPGDFFEAVIVSTPGTGAAPANIVFQVQLIEN